MTAHPAFQPTLTRGNVATMLRFITNERDDVKAQPGSVNNAEDAAYIMGLEFAENAVKMMWASAVIAADAHAQDLAAALAEVEQEGSDPREHIQEAIDSIDFAIVAKGAKDIERLDIARGHLVAARALEGEP